MSFHILSSKNICYIILIVFINQLQTFESLVFDEKDLSKAGVELTKYWSGSIHMFFFLSSPFYPLSSFWSFSFHFRADWLPMIGARQPSGLDY